MLIKKAGECNAWEFIRVKCSISNNLIYRNEQNSESMSLELCKTYVYPQPAKQNS